MDKSTFLSALRSNQHYLSLEGIEDELCFRPGYLTKAIKDQKMSEKNYRLLQSFLQEILSGLMAE